MEKNVVRDTVVPTSVTLVSAEGYCVTKAGVKTSSNGQWAHGVVFEGHAVNTGSVVTIRGRCSAKVDGSSVNISAGDPLCANSSGKFIKATIGTDDVRAHAIEAVTTDTDSYVELL